MNDSAPGWDSPAIRPAGEASRIARYRRLQSWYREVQLGAPAGRSGRYDPLGSYLDLAAVAQQPDLNFLHPGAHEHAEQRIVEVQREGGTLEPTRLRHNMLSSMPLCFNLFGAMRAEPAFVKVFRDLFDPEASRIEQIVCEWAPAHSEAGIGDRTAFDAVVRYTTDDGPRVLGVETKYTESFSVKDYDTPRYREVTAVSPWFADGADVDLLKGRDANQLWRGVMLASQVERHEPIDRATVAVVALADDPGARKAFTAVSSQLASGHRDRLSVVSLESIVDSASAVPELAWWATSFRRRYLDADLPDRADATHDPVGPRFGRDLRETADAARAGREHE